MHGTRWKRDTLYRPILTLVTDRGVGPSILTALSTLPWYFVAGLSPFAVPFARLTAAWAERSVTAFCIKRESPDGASVNSVQLRTLTTTTAHAHTHYKHIRRLRHVLTYTSAHTQTLSHTLSLSVCLFVYLSVCLPLSVSLSVSLSFWHTHTHTHIYAKYSDITKMPTGKGKEINKCKVRMRVQVICSLFLQSVGVIRKII